MPSLQRAASALAAIDVLATHAVQSATLRWTQPVFSDAPGLSIRGGQHPVVAAQVEHFIPNDVALGPDRRLLIVTGPNMGGKSTYMRQTAVIALLAHCGLFVPASEAIIGPMDAIYTRIGAADDLAGGRSTFMVEMTEAAYILNRATPSSLVLIDEIGRGTSTFDGLALAWAIARELASNNRSMTLFATHYFELTALPSELEGCANVHFDAVLHKDRIVFLHAVEDGPANQSYGLQVAKLAGVPAEAVRQARAFLSRLDHFSARRDDHGDLFSASPPSGGAGAGRFTRSRSPGRAGARRAFATRRARGALRAEAPRGQLDQRPHRPRPRSVVVVAVRAVHVPVSHLFGRRRTNVQHRAIEAQTLPGERMVAVDDHLAVGDVGDRVHLHLVVFAVAPRRPGPHDLRTASRP